MKNFVSTMIAGYFCIALTCCGDESNVDEQSGGANPEDVSVSRSGASGCSASSETTPQNGECYGNADEFICEVEHAIHELTNTSRQNDGLSTTFRFSHQLTHAAREWSKEMIGDGKLSHDGFPAERYASINAEFSEPTAALNAENVGVLFTTPGTSATYVAEQLTEGWWNSPGHKQNIVASYTHMGVGAYTDPASGTLYATQIFGCE